MVTENSSYRSGPPKPPATPSPQPTETPKQRHADCCCQKCNPYKELG